MCIKVFIIMFNRLTWPKAMAEFLSDTGCEVILIDNNSTYPPLLEWYNTCPYKIYRLNQNMGYKALYSSGISKEYTDRYYALTDHDLDISSVPKDLIGILMDGLKRNEDIIKSGLSLRIDDLPKNDYTNNVISWESQYWQSPKDDFGFYKSFVDTTFAIYDKEREYVGFPSGNEFLRAVRSPYPYVARHLPWYNTPENLTDEESNYLKTTSHVSYWSDKFKKTIWV